jgi:hypothetical protein
MGCPEGVRFTVKIETRYGSEADSIIQDWPRLPRKHLYRVSQIHQFSG